ncbi:hypothetical protein Acsp05_45570 [Actinokineospora sp. NBRC 105648]|nr:hypothetical protein Acsp05_45570 [Actinokineospora sp. NBRC 105648]
MADRVLTILHSIYREFWGPRTDDLLRAALFSLTHTRAPDGSDFTLIEIPDLFTNPGLRQYVMRQPSLPPHLRTYWQQFDAQSTEARLNAIAPVLNKLRAFTMRTPIRLMLGQSDGIRLDAQFRRKSVLLVSLAKGALGSESAHLLGSLFVGALWQATLSRTQFPPERRAPVFAYLDEFQDIVRFGTSSDLADMLAQARGLGLGLGLAHQYLNQLSATMQQAVLGTVRSTVAFQTDHNDAVALARRFAPLVAADLQGLSAYEIVARLSTNGATGMPVTGVTLPLSEATGGAHELATASQQRHGRTRDTVEAGLEARLDLPGPVRPGRRTWPGGAA